MASERLVIARAMFGLRPVDASERRAPDARGAARDLHRALRPGEIALVTGPSGGGKSSLLRALAQRLRRAAILADPARLAREPRAVIDLFRSPPAESMRTLARAGLADATLLHLRPRELSEGQRWRLALAVAMHRASGGAGVPPVLLLDEFCSTLDRLTAAGVARSVRRWSWSRPDLRIVCATSHDDLLEWLAPDVVVFQPLARPPEIRRTVRGEAA